MIARIRVFFSNEIVKKIVKIVVGVLVAFYVFSLPSFSGREKYNIITYIALGMLGAFSAFFLFVYKINLKDNRIFYFLFFIISTLPGTIFYSRNYRGILTLLLLFSSMIILYIAFLILHSERQVLVMVTIGLSLFAIYFSVHYRAQLMRLPSLLKTSLRLGSDFGNENTIGIYMLIGFVINYFMLLFRKQKIEFIYIVFILIFVFVGFLTGSKKFIICLLFSLVAVPYFKIKKKKWIYFVVVFSLLALLLVALLLPIFSSVRSRFLIMFSTLFGFDTGDTRIDYSTFQRILFIRYGFYLGSKNLIFGLGYDGFMAFSGIPAYSHSNFVELIVDFGIFGCLIFYFILFKYFNDSKKNNNLFSKLSIVFVLIFIINSLTYVFFISKETYLIISLILFFLNNKSNELIKKNSVHPDGYRELTI